MLKKTLFVIATIVAMSQTVSAQDESVYAMMKDPGTFAAIMTSQCPIEISGIGTMTHVEYTDKQLWLYFTMNEEYNNVEALKYSMAETKHSVKLSFATNPILKVVVLGLIENDSQLCLRYYGKKTKESLIISLTQDDLMDIITMNSEETSALSWLKNQVEMARLQCPLKIDENMTMISVQFEDNDIYYVIEVNETDMTVGEMKPRANEVKSSILANLKSMASINTIQQTFISKCIQNDSRIVYKYVGSRTKEVMLVIISVADLQSL